MDECTPIVDADISTSILDRADERAKSVDWYCKKRLIPDFLLSWIVRDFRY